MGTGFDLTRLYSSQNIQNGNFFASNNFMQQNANAAVAGNYKLTIPQLNFFQSNH